MGAIIAVISDKLSNTTVPGHEGFPWDQSSEPINEIISEAKGNSPGSSKTTESNTKSQFTCHHFTSPHTCKSLYHRNSYSSTKSCNHGYYRICNICNNSNFIASFLACQHCSEYDCYCQCSVCGGPHPESKCGYASSVSPSCGSLYHGLTPITIRIELIMNLRL